MSHTALLRLWALAAGCMLAQGAVAQAPGPASPPATPQAGVAAACPKVEEMNHLHLYGLWRAEFSGLAQGATLLFEKHPEFAESVRGGINRDGVQGLVAGDVNKGEFALDESADGRTISASWAGTVVEQSCGKEIRGTWTRAFGNQEHGFILRKVPGWQ